jgi:hypothetical protein
VVANYEQYIGKAALIEMGYAISLGMMILTLEPVEDPNLRPYCREIKEIFPKISQFLIKNDNPVPHNYNGHIAMEANG